MKKIVILIQVESIVLPKNGLLVFTDNGVDLGGTANWQCAKNDLEKPKGKREIMGCAGNIFCLKFKCLNNIKLSF